MKRTPASSHQCHCQRASVPMATKGRKREGEKEGGTAAALTGVDDCAEEGQKWVRTH